MPSDMIADAPLPHAALERAQLQSLSLRSNAAAGWRIASHFGAVLGLGLAIAWAGPLWGLPLVVLQGWLLAFLFMPLHEMAHKTAFASRRANVVVGNVCGAAILLPYEYYTLFHWAHHRHTQDPARDPELLVTPPPSTATGLALWFAGYRQVYFRARLMLRHALSGAVRLPWVPAGKQALVVREARWLTGLYALLLLGSVAAGSAALLWAWLLPLVIGQFFLRPYLLAEHTGCGHTGNAFENTRTISTNPLVMWFSWNMPYHTEHHAYPSVPFHALPRLHAAVEGRLQHRGQGYARVAVQVWRWLRERQAASTESTSRRA